MIEMLANIIHLQLRMIIIECNVRAVLKEMAQPL